MSEYEYVVFQAVDRPLNDKELAFAEKQSSHAEVSQWALSCEYHYGYFRGSVDGLLKRGYDVFLRYTSYDDRQIKLRLPQGLPFPKSVWSKYIDGKRLAWKQDSRGTGGILSLQSYFDDLEYAESFPEYLNSAVQIRQRLIAGDLRGLYLLWLCSVEEYYEDSGDYDVIEPPVPHGLAGLSDVEGELLLFFGHDPMLLHAAAEDVGRAANVETPDQPVRRWARSIPPDRASDLLGELLSGDTASIKARLLAEVRDSQPPVNWPTSDKRRTFSQLVEQADVLRRKADAAKARKAQAKAKRDAAKAEQQRQSRMKEMVKDPQKWLRETEKLAEARGVENYKSAAEILFDLREVLGEDGQTMIRQHTAHLTKKFPTLTHFKSALRKRGLLD